MVKLAEYNNGEYHDILFYEDKMNISLAIDSLKKDKYNGSVFNFKENVINYLNKHELNYFKDSKQEINLDDLKKTRDFTVVVNNEFLIFRKNGEHHFRIFNFREFIEDLPNKDLGFNVRTVKINQVTEKIGEIKSIKTKLIFKKRLDNI